MPQDHCKALAALWSALSKEQIFGMAPSSELRTGPQDRSSNSPPGPSSPGPAASISEATLAISSQLSVDNCPHYRTHSHSWQPLGEAKGQEEPPGLQSLSQVVLRVQACSYPRDPSLYTTAARAHTHLLRAGTSCKALCQAAAHAAAGRDPPSSAASRLRKFPQWLCLRSPLLPTTFPERIPRQLYLKSFGLEQLLKQTMLPYQAKGHLYGKDVSKTVLYIVRVKAESAHYSKIHEHLTGWLQIHPDLPRLSKQRGSSCQQDPTQVLRRFLSPLHGVTVPCPQEQDTAHPRGDAPAEQGIDACRGAVAWLREKKEEDSENTFALLINEVSTQSELSNIYKRNIYKSFLKLLSTQTCIESVKYGVVIHVEKMVDINKEGGDVGVWPWGSESPVVDDNIRLLTDMNKHIDRLLGSAKLSKPLREARTESCWKQAHRSWGLQWDCLAPESRSCLFLRTAHPYADGADCSYLECRRDSEPAYAVLTFVHCGSRIILKRYSSKATFPFHAPMPALGQHTMRLGGSAYAGHSSAVSSSPHATSTSRLPLPPGAKQHSWGFNSVRLRESSTDCNFSSNYKADAEDLALLCIRLHEAVFQSRLRTLHSCGWSNSRGRKRYSSHENTEVQKYRVKAQTLSTSTPQQAQHHKGAAVCPKSYHMLEKELQGELLVWLCSRAEISSGCDCRKSSPLLLTSVVWHALRSAQGCCGKEGGRRPGRSRATGTSDGAGTKSCDRVPEPQLSGGQTRAPGTARPCCSLTVERDCPVPPPALTSLWVHLQRRSAPGQTRSAAEQGIRQAGLILSAPSPLEGATRTQQPLQGSIGSLLPCKADLEVQGTLVEADPGVLGFVSLLVGFRRTANTPQLVTGYSRHKEIPTAAACAWEGESAGQTMPLTLQQTFTRTTMDHCACLQHQLCSQNMSSFLTVHVDWPTLQFLAKCLTARSCLPTGKLGVFRLPEAVQGNNHIQSMPVPRTQEFFGEADYHLSFSDIPSDSPINESYHTGHVSPQAQSLRFYSTALLGGCGQQQLPGKICCYPILSSPDSAKHEARADCCQLFHLHKAESNLVAMNVVCGGVMDPTGAAQLHLFPFQGIVASDLQGCCFHLGKKWLLSSSIAFANADPGPDPAPTRTCAYSQENPQSCTAARDGSLHGTAHILILLHSPEQKLLRKKRAAKEIGSYHLCRAEEIRAAKMQPSHRSQEGYAGINSVIIKAVLEVVRYSSVQPAVKITGSSPTSS
ncbi:hypothetical protein Anapl_15994 [Anas platyrhynchos]|uniref:Uncharacterized protein n=1 Tax=Anas platyrhynchos TaxID=8839 RepID=R0KZN0_ANAPL|nr:hypothetical protein Anapl_15994 [Anas platyrhynchos]